MILIGVTGGIGSGKSVVCSQFEKFGIQVFYADQVAKKIPRLYPEILDEVSDEFGEQTVLRSTKTLNTEKIAEIVFFDKQKLHQLNTIIHPFVFRELNRWTSTITKDTRYAIVEAALIFESGMDELVDYVLGITADEKIRIQRVLERDNLSVEQITARIKNQITVEELEQFSDFLLKNNGTISDLFTTVSFYHTLFLTLQKRNETL
ncbi:MAG: dephospho-CoA kinase [Bacteroidota bacterium]|jgi:dephospho-CoA kinase